MPELSRFYGIIIRMFSIDNEHPPKRARILSREWAEQHQEELLEMWDTQNFHKIEPLE